mgnify:CR=1 FL=1
MRLLLLTLLIVFFGCLNRNKASRISIVPATLLNETITHPSKDSNYISRFDYFIVKEGNDDRNKNVIEEYAKKHRTDSIKFYKHYEMIFFKESKRINIETIKDTEPEYHWKLTITEEPIVTYIWIDGEFAR